MFARLPQPELIEAPDLQLNFAEPCLFRVPLALPVFRPDDRQCEGQGCCLHAPLPAGEKDTGREDSKHGTYFLERSNIVAGRLLQSRVTSKLAWWFLG